MVSIGATGRDIEAEREAGTELVAVTADLLEARGVSREHIGEETVAPTPRSGGSSPVRTMTTIS